ncbi:MAG TPA: hypothetical protein VK694_04195 [Verrucomicrobiae bacterium]|nr:hypothetical protein [Verrucomicrobiae bacterium]
MKKPAQKPSKRHAIIAKNAHHVHRIKKHVRLPALVLAFRALAIFVLLVVLIRPQVSAQTAVKLRFVGCVAISDRRLQAKPGQTITFRVISDVDDTFVLKKFNISKDLKAHKAQFVTVKAAADPGWYEYKLAHCNFAGYLPILTDKNELPPMSKGDHVHGLGKPESNMEGMDMSPDDTPPTAEEQHDASHE